MTYRSVLHFAREAYNTELVLVLYLRGSSSNADLVLKCDKITNIIKTYYYILQVLTFYGRNSLLKFRCNIKI